MLPVIFVRVQLITTMAAFFERRGFFGVYYFIGVQYIIMSNTSFQTVDASWLRNRYQTLLARLEERRTDKPLTLCEKILLTHKRDDGRYEVDGLFLSDVSAQNFLHYLLELEAAGKAITLPELTGIANDHQIQSTFESSASEDLGCHLESPAGKASIEFLSSAGQKFGLHIWRTESGIIHRIIMEHYMCPGLFFVIIDSHAHHSGTMGGICIGSGDPITLEMLAYNNAVTLPKPRKVVVFINGTMPKDCSAKTVILRVMDMIRYGQLKGCMIEYVVSPECCLSAEDIGLLCNMGAELGALASFIQYRPETHGFMGAMEKDEIAAVCDDPQFQPLFKGDDEVYASPRKYFDEVYYVALESLSPSVSGLNAPDKVHAIANFNPTCKLHSVQMASCMQSYYDIFAASYVAEHYVNQGRKVVVPTVLSAPSNTVIKTLRKMGRIQVFEQAGIKIAISSCAGCIGKLQYGEDVENQLVLHSAHRASGTRNTGFKTANVAISSTQDACASAFEGRVVVAPVVEVPSTKLPEGGFEVDYTLFDTTDYGGAVVMDGNYVAPMPAFPVRNFRWDFTNIPVVAKYGDRISTDNIIPASFSPLFGENCSVYRGNLEKLSQVCFWTAKNTLTGFDGEDDWKAGRTMPIEVMRNHGKSAIVAGELYGCDSSRAHAALLPLLAGLKVVLAKSYFAIHERNAQYMGILMLTYKNKGDADLIVPNTTMTVLEPEQISLADPTVLVELNLNGEKRIIETQHGFSTEDQLLWFREGSILNYAKQ